MRRERKDNSSFWKGATRGKPGKALTPWQKRPHFHRSLIRNGVFWPIILVLVLLAVNRIAALLAFITVSIPVLYLAFRKGRLIFFLPFTSTDAVTGDMSQHWILRNKWRRILHRQPIPGQVARKDRVTMEFPADLEETLRKSISADEDGKGIQPPVKVKPYRRR